MGMVWDGEGASWDVMGRGGLEDSFRSRFNMDWINETHGKYHALIQGEGETCWEWWMFW